MAGKLSQSEEILNVGKTLKKEDEDLRNHDEDSKDTGIMGGKWIISLAFLSILIGYGYTLFTSQLDLSSSGNYFNMTQMVGKHPDYVLSEYTAKTRDGYILNIYRLNSRKVSISRKSPVFLMHGVMLSSEDFVRLGPERSLGYLLADSGYDVWIGNYRGNRYTSHTTLSKKDAKFWDYSYDEHGLEDVPAMLNSVLKYSKSERLHYIGFSMGSSGYLIMCHTRPEMRKKIVSFIGLAPAATLNVNLAPAVSILYKFRAFKMLRLLRFDPIAIPGTLLRAFTNSWCTGSNKFNVCNELISLLVGRDDEQIDKEKIASFYGRLNPLSVKTLEHFSQGILSKRLKMFDFGASENKIKYGELTPPLYNVSNNIAPTAFFYGKNDLLVPSAVGIIVAKEMVKTNPVVLQKYFPFDNFTHMDFLMAKDLKKLANNEIVKQQIEFSEKFDL